MHRIGPLMGYACHWQAWPELNKHLGDSRKSATARYLQLKSGHAVTGVHLYRTKKVQNGRCRWCGSRQKNVSHLMFTCRKWRRERESMLSTIAFKKIKILARMNGQDLKTLFREASNETVLQCIESTSVGKRVEACDARRSDERDIERLDRDIDKDWGG